MGLLANGDPDGTIPRLGIPRHRGGGDGLRHNLYVGNIASRSSTTAASMMPTRSRAALSPPPPPIRAFMTAAAGSYSIDLPNGGVGVIRNNVIQQRPVPTTPASSIT